MRPTIGIRLKELREKKNLRQEQIADMIGVDRSAISLYESGMRQPSFDVLVALSRLFRVSTDYLLGINDAKTIDLTGLTGQEIDVLAELVALMVKKNEIINKQ